MSVAFTTHITYHLDDRRTSNWSTTQEKGISTAYPFDLRAAGPEDYVARTYLQFLWLPSSVMPLTHLVPSLQRASSPSGSSTTIHPMHGFLEPLLLTTRLVSKKYHTELAQILTNGGGAGEMEEAMMWYVVEHEKMLGDDSQQLGGSSSPYKHGEGGDDGPWTNEAWRKKYLERMEKREVQIQILLYLFKLSLPGPQPPPTAPELGSPKPKSKKRKRSEMPESVDTTEDRLEAFMDKLAMWQLVSRIDDAFNPVDTKRVDKNNKDERDWAQIFAEDIVEPQFKSKFPESCKLLRSKVFPTSPFSDSESVSTRKASPEPIASTSPTTTYVRTGVPLKQSLSRTASTSFSRTSSLSKPCPSPTHTTVSTTSNSSRTLVRSRSRSLSLSLAQEQEEHAAAVAAAVEQKKKGRLNREVSMSRVFKNKGKGKNKEADGGKTNEGVPGATLKIEPPKVEKPSQIDNGVTLVEETPVKSRVPSAFAEEGKGQRQLVPIVPLTFGVAKLLPDGGKPASVIDDDEEEEWMVDSSPNIVLFDPLLEKRKKLKMQGTSDKGGITPIHEDSDEEWNKACDPAVDQVQKVETQVPSSQPRRTRKPLRKKAKREST